MIPIVDGAIGMVPKGSEKKGLEEQKIREIIETIPITVLLRLVRILYT